MPLFLACRDHISADSNTRNAEEMMYMSKSRVVTLELLGKLEIIRAQKEG